MMTNEQAILQMRLKSEKKTIMLVRCYLCQNSHVMVFFWNGKAHLNLPCYDVSASG